MLSSIGSRAAADPEELHFRREARSRFVRTFLRYPAALPALILFVIVVLCALGAPLLTQYTPFEGNAAERLQGIGTAGHHCFGFLNTTITYYNHFLKSL